LTNGYHLFDSLRGQFSKAERGEKKGGRKGKKKKGGKGSDGARIGRSFLRMTLYLSSRCKTKGGGDEKKKEKKKGERETVNTPVSFVLYAKGERKKEAWKGGKKREKRDTPPIQRL